MLGDLHASALILCDSALQQQFRGRGRYVGPRMRRIALDEREVARTEIEQCQQGFLTCPLSPFGAVQLPLIEEHHAGVESDANSQHRRTLSEVEPREDIL